MLGIKSPHQLLVAADHTYRHSAGDRLAIYHYVGLHAEVFLRATWGEAKAAENLVENQWYSGGAANLAQLAQPLRIGRTRILGLSHITGKKNRVAGRR